MFPIIDVAGAPRERGRKHGARARERIARSIANYARLFAWCGLAWDDVQRRATAYRDQIGDLAPALVDEIAGIAAGAGVRETEILALNARTEILPPTYPGLASPSMASILARNGAALPGNAREIVADIAECTALAVLPKASADRHTWLAQNWDWLGSQRDALVVLRIAGDDGSRIVTLTEAGMLAKIGINDRGFGVCLNILRSVDDGQIPGCPVHVLLRHRLSCGDVAEARATAAAIRHGASSNVLCADAGGHAASLELSPRGVAVIEPGDDGTLAHTNHYLDETLGVKAAALSPLATTAQRLACAKRHAARVADRPLSREAIAALLRDDSEGGESVCREPDPALEPEVRIETVAGVMMDLDRRTMWIAPDVPSRAEFEAVTLV